MDLTNEIQPTFLMNIPSTSKIVRFGEMSAGTD